jgi:hypothetical protein
VPTLLPALLPNPWSTAQVIQARVTVARMPDISPTEPDPL